MLETIVLTRQQEAAITQVKTWFQEETKTKPVFVVAGFAGTGKSSCVSYALDECGINPARIATVTYTGKAALVLTRKGTPAQTIHSLIYEPILEEFFDERYSKIRIKCVGFDLKSPKLLKDFLDIIVVDEVSMVGVEQWRDLLSFGIPILALGDPAQLPPVKQDRTTILDTPDVFLSEIHRQAADNPIIWLSMQAREGNRIVTGSHGGLVHITRNTSHTPLSEFDQIICCTNKRVDSYNKRTRKLLKRDSLLPEPGEKLINLKNHWKILSSMSRTPLVNGLTVRTLDEPYGVSQVKRRFRLWFAIEDLADDTFPPVDVNLDHFEPLDDQPVALDGHEIQLKYGYAISVHRAQGSQWTNVCFVADLFGDRETKRQLLYTGCTRASEKLDLVLVD